MQLGADDMHKQLIVSLGKSQESYKGTVRKTLQWTLILLLFKRQCAQQQAGNRLAPATNWSY